MSQLKPEKPKRCAMRFSIASRPTSALTLLEVTLALAVTGLLLTSVYGITSSCLRLSSQIDTDQHREMRRNAFVEFCRSNLRQIPAAAEVTFQAEQSGSNYTSQLTVANAPTAFQFGSSSNDSTVLRTEVELGGTLLVRLGDLVLLRGIGRFEWKLHDAVVKEWLPVWDDPTRRPDAIELTFGFSGETPRRYVFWTPKLSLP